LEHPITGFRNISIIDILNHLEAAYGTLTPSVFAKIMVEVDKPFEDHTLEGFQNSSSALKKNFAILAINGQPLSEMQKMKKLIDNCMHFQGMNDCIRQYYIVVPAIANQNFQGLILFIITHYNNFITIPKNPYSSRSFASTRSSSPGKRPQSPDKAKESISVKKFFCYVHGKNSTHNGMDCFYMKNKKNINKDTKKPFGKSEMEATMKD
jgi:hypothetical protein